MTSASFISYLNENNIFWYISSNSIYFMMDYVPYVALIDDNVIWVFNREFIHKSFFKLSDLLAYHKSIT